MLTLSSDFEFPYDKLVTLWSRVLPDKLKVAKNSVGIQNPTHAVKDVNAHEKLCLNKHALVF